ncbi:MAG: hypothetical protein LBV17_02890 [Treponema sp.]|jgi:hypothetical protein|nr:hypothetical protein [Treponema sp.]
MVNVIGDLCNGKQYYSKTTNSDFFESWFEHNLLEKIPNGCTVNGQCEVSQEKRTMEDS